MVAAKRAPIRVVGRYALYNEIAAGGMATIHLGRLLGPVGFARTVAVKRLHPQFAKDPEFVSMFLDEARLAARVQHPNVVATIDVVATEGELFLIMDYVRGESLSKILRASGKQDRRAPPRIAAAIMCGFLHGLHAAHEAKNERGEPLGLVHRDVSPQNVLVGADGIARVLDFGIAKAQGRIQVTRDGQIKGKLAYMPPEQLTGRGLSRTVDIYASAVVMWEALTGTRLFKGETEAATLAKILRDSVRPPSSVVPGLPKTFDALLLKALDRNPSKRHATAKELALEIERCSELASTTEVGDWVEANVGNVLSAREEEIADIESSSAGMSVSQSMLAAPPESASDGYSSPSVRSLLASARAASSHTSSMGSGAAESNQENAEGATVTVQRASDEGSAPKSRPGLTGTGLTGSLSMLLPVDRKLTILASIAGVVVLAVALALVIGGRSSQRADKPSSAPSSAASTTPPPVRPDPNRVIPEPSPPADSAAAPSVLAVVPTPASSEVPLVRTPPKPAIVAAPPHTPKVSVVPTSKRNCEPPYTIDESGRRKYKLECM